MKEISIIFRKELARIFGDKKMVFSLFILPAIIMVGIYSLMGVLIDKVENDQEKHVSKVYIQNIPQGFQDILDSTFDSNEVEYNTVQKENQELDEKIRQQVLNSEIDLALVFSPTFLDDIKAYQSGSTNVPEVQTYYNPSGDYSENVRTMFLNLLEGYRTKLLSERVEDFNSLVVFTVDTSFTDGENAIFDESVASGKIIGTILPYFITLLLFAGVMSLGADTFTGEKERGTMATMLITPIKRSSIVFGKLFALMVLSAMSALVYGVSMIIAMPMMSKGFGDMGGMSFSLSPEQMIMLLFIIITLVFVYVALVSVTAVFAKTVKEASTYIMPAYMIVIVCGMMTMFVTGKPHTIEYLIPLYGSSMALRNILTQDITMAQCLLSVASNLVVGGAISIVLTKAFNSEKVMFNA